MNILDEAEKAKDLAFKMMAWTENQGIPPGRFVGACMLIVVAAVRDLKLRGKADLSEEMLAVLKKLAGMQEEVTSPDG